MCLIIYGEVYYKWTSDQRIIGSSKAEHNQYYSFSCYVNWRHPILWVYLNQTKPRGPFQSGKRWLKFQSIIVITVTFAKYCRPIIRNTNTTLLWTQYCSRNASKIRLSNWLSIAHIYRPNYKNGFTYNRCDSLPISISWKNSNTKYHIPCDRVFLCIMTDSL